MQINNKKNGVILLKNDSIFFTYNMFDYFLVKAFKKSMIE